MTTPNPFARDEVVALDARHLDSALTLQAPAAYCGDSDEDPMRDVEVRHGVAIVTIRGLLSNDGWWCETYQDVVRRMEASLASRDVRAVVMDVESPGGTTSGLFDAMRRLRSLKAAAGKRVVAYCGAQGTSAAYGLMSVADEIVIDETAGVGSIGTIGSLTSRVEQLKQSGVDMKIVASGTEKTDGHPAVPISKAAVGRLEERVAAVNAIFLAEVAAGRPALTVAQMEALDAGVRYGRAAVAAGLADRLGTLDGLLASLAPPAPPNPYAAPRTGALAPPTRMNMNEKTAALIAAKTGESDPERQHGALQALLDKAEKYDALSAKVEKIEKDAADAEFERTVKKGLDARKISDDEAAWWREEYAAGRASARSLDANLSKRAAAKLAAADPAHLDAKQPQDEARTAATSPRVAQLLAKPYGALSWDERNELGALDPQAHERTFAAWVEAGRPKG